MAVLGPMPGNDCSTFGFAVFSHLTMLSLCALWSTTRHADRTCTPCKPASPDDCPSVKASLQSMHYGQTSLFHLCAAACSRS